MMAEQTTELPEPPLAPLSRIDTFRAHMVASRALMAKQYDLLAEFDAVNAILAPKCSRWAAKTVTEGQE